MSGPVKGGLLCSHGMTVAAGVPGMALLSVGPVVAMAGHAAIIVWPVSALCGAVMSLLFSSMVAAHSDSDNGGVVVAAARILERKSFGLSALTQWAYWFGWAPTPAIYGATIGAYFHSLFTPASTGIDGIVISFLVTIFVFTLNLFPLVLMARLQGVLAFIATCTLTVFAFRAIYFNSLGLSNIYPVAPPGGWASWKGLSAVFGALFLAGWSAYGAEIALTYLKDYRDGCRAACRSTSFTAAVTFISYTIFPFLMILSIDPVLVVKDPSVALASSFGLRNTLIGEFLLFAALCCSMLLAINMTTVASSCLLGQMSKDGFCRIDLSSVNYAGRPWKALLFDLSANIALLLTIVVLSRGHLSAVPVTLLATANVGYFFSLVICQFVGAASDMGRSGISWRSLLGLGLAFANTVFLMFGGVAWGWESIVLGSLALITVSSMMCSDKRYGRRHENRRPIHGISKLQ